MTVAAAIATLERLGRDDGEIYRTLEARGARLQSGLEGLYREKGWAAVVSRIGSAFCTYFSDHVPVDWHDLAASHDFNLDRRYRRELINHGIYHFPLPAKQGSLSAAHSDDDIDRTLELTREAMSNV